MTHVHKAAVLGHKRLVAKKNVTIASERSIFTCLCDWWSIRKVECLLVVLVKIWLLFFFIVIVIVVLTCRTFLMHLRQQVQVMLLGLRPELTSALMSTPIFSYFGNTSALWVKRVIVFHLLFKNSFKPINCLWNPWVRCALKNLWLWNFPLLQNFLAFIRVINVCIRFCICFYNFSFTTFSLIGTYKVSITLVKRAILKLLSVLICKFECSHLSSFVHVSARAKLPWRISKPLYQNFLAFCLHGFFH